MQNYIHFSLKGPYMFTDVFAYVNLGVCGLKVMHIKVSCNTQLYSEHQTDYIES